MNVDERVQSMNDLECLLQVGPILKELFEDEDVMIAITDRKEILEFIPGKTMVFGKKGDRLVRGEGLIEVIESGKTHREKVSKDVLGLPYKTVAVPIRDEKRQVIGTIGFGWSLDWHERMTQISENLVSSLQQISASISEIANTAQEVASVQQSMVDSARQTKQDANQATKITDVIKNLSSQSHMLGLNAAIEAARANEHGRGFAVVANEVRKLASDSRNSVVQIEQGLRNMAESIDHILQQITSNTNHVTSQAAATQEILQAIQQLNELSQHLNELANEV